MCATGKPTVGFLAILALLLQLATTKPTRAEEKTVPPTVGDVVDDFELSRLDGKKQSLSKLSEKGPVVLVVLRGYPGYQCPLCTKQVSQLVGSAAKFQDLKARVVLIYPGSSDKLKSYAEQFLGDKELPEGFQLLIDPDYAFTNAYHLRWNAPQETAFPATFVIDKDRKVRFARVSKTHGGRASIDEVLKALEK